MPNDSVQTLFDVKFPAALARAPEKAREVGAVYGFKIGGEGGGEWTVDLRSDPVSCVKGLGQHAQCTLEVSADDFVAMLANPAYAMQFYFQGRLRVTGDPMLATRLQKLFSLAAVESGPPASP